MAYIIGDFVARPVNATVRRPVPEEFMKCCARHTVLIFFLCLTGSVAALPRAAEGQMWGPPQPRLTVGLLLGMIKGAGTEWAFPEYASDVMPPGPAMAVTGTARILLKRRIALDLDLGYARSPKEQTGDWHSLFGPDGGNDTQTMRIDYSDVFVRALATLVPGREQGGFFFGLGVSGHFINAPGTNHIRGNLLPLGCGDFSFPTSYDCVVDISNSFTDIGIAMLVGADFRLSDRTTLVASLNFDESPKGSVPCHCTKFTTVGGITSTSNEDAIDRGMYLVNMGLRFRVGH